jgi:hypothetical protein
VFLAGRVKPFPGFLMGFQSVNHPGTSIVVAVNLMIRSRLGVFDLKLGDSKPTADTAIFANIKPVTS